MLIMRVRCVSAWYRASGNQGTMDTSIATLRGTVTIRSAREEDAPAYRDLRLEALRNHPEAFSSDYAANLAKPMAFWAERLRSSGPDSAGMIYFAVHDQQLVGMCGIYRANSPKIQHSATVVGMYVRPDWRGFRIAGGLVNPAWIGHVLRRSRSSISPWSRRIRARFAATPAVGFRCTESSRKRFTTRASFTMSC